MGNRLVAEREFNRWKDALQGDLKRLETDVKAAASFWLVNKLTFNGYMNGTCCSWQKLQAQRLLDHREKRFQHMLGFKPLGPRRLAFKVCNCFDAIEACGPDALLFLDPP